jgi:Family of unknown function (DUF5678)
LHFPRLLLEEPVEIFGESVMSGVAELEKDIKAEQELSRQLRSFIGQWVVIYKHEVVANAGTPSEALEKAPARFDRILRVPRTSGSALL